MCECRQVCVGECSACECSVCECSVCKCGGMCVCGVCACVCDTVSSVPQTLCLHFIVPLTDTCDTCDTCRCVFSRTIFNVIRHYSDKNNGKNKKGRTSGLRLPSHNPP